MMGDKCWMLFLPEPVHWSGYLWTGYTGGQHNPPPYLAGAFR